MVHIICLTPQTSCSAETQGQTDRFISTWLKNQKREDLVLATKVCTIRLPEGSRHPVSHMPENHTMSGLHLLYLCYNGSQGAESSSMLGMYWAWE